MKHTGSSGLVAIKKPLFPILQLLYMIWIHSHESPWGAAVSEVATDVTKDFLVEGGTAACCEEDTPDFGALHKLRWHIANVLE